MCHRTTSLICRSLPWNRVRTSDHAPSLDGQQFSRVRVIAVRAFWLSGRHSDGEGRVDI